MPRLLSGSTLRRGGSGQYIDLKGAQPQLPPTPSTSTGFTLVTDDKLVTTYRSSLGNIQMHLGEMYSNLPGQDIKLIGTDSNRIIVAGGTANTSTNTGALVVEGGIGVWGSIHTGEDIHVNGLTIGQGWQGQNNIVIQGLAQPQANEFLNGQQSIAIGWSALDGLDTSYKSIAIGRHALHSGTEVANSIAIGDGALKASGSIHYLFASTITGVTLSNALAITNISSAVTATVTAAAHGLTTGTRVYIDGVVGVTSGTTSIVNTNTFWINVTGANTFDIYDNFALNNGVDTSAATPYTSGGTVYTPTIVSGTAHALTTGSRVLLTDILGTTELNNQSAYVDVLNTTTVALYTDTILQLPLISNTFTNYASSGTVYRYLLRNNNIAIGVDAGRKLIDGQGNYFFGDRIARNLTTGSHNFLVGNEVGQELTHGNHIIAIGGDNLVDGVDNQVNIGSVFYYNGGGYTQINSDLGVGINTGSTGTNSGALVVLGGVGISENLYVGGNILPGNASVTLGSASSPFAAVYVAGTTVYLGGIQLKSPNNLSFTVTSTAGFVTQTIGNLVINSNVQSNVVGSGALNVTGGASISGNLNVGEELNVLGLQDVNLSPQTADVFLKPTLGGSVEIRPSSTGKIDNMDIGSLDPAAGTFEQLTVVGTATSTSTNTGAVRVAGGVGITRDAYIGNDLTVAGMIYGTATFANNLTNGQTGSIPYQFASGQTAFIDIGPVDTVLRSNGTTATWSTISSLSAGTATNANNILVVEPGTTSTYYVNFTPATTGYNGLHATSVLSYNTVSSSLSVVKLHVTSTATSTSTSTISALTVDGGIGVGADVYVEGSVYSAEGNADENYLLYTPRVTVSTTPPAGPRIGDFWINSNTGRELQYIKDGTSTFWVQFTGL